MRCSPASSLHQHLRQIAIGGRSGDERDVGRALEDLFALLLGDAAEHGELLALACSFLYSLRRWKTFCSALSRMEQVL